MLSGSLVVILPDPFLTSKPACSDVSTKLLAAGSLLRRNGTVKESKDGKQTNPAGMDVYFGADHGVKMANLK